MMDNIYNKLNTLAQEVGCPKIKEQYQRVRTAMQRNFVKQYAILGDVNAGKSTIINILAGEKRLPVSARSNEHEKVAVVDSPEHNCEWVELNTCTYAGEGLVDADSPLWYIDAAIYVLSATTPFSKQDLESIKTCIAHGVPCTLALSKLDAVDEAEKEEIIAYIKAQSERHFGSSSLLLVNIRDEAATKQAIMTELTSAEDSKDVRDYMLAVSYAKNLKKYITVQYEAAKEEMQRVTQQEKQAKQTKLDASVAWDRIQVAIETRKKKLIEAMSVEMNRLYDDCIAALAERAMAAPSPKEWWEKSLEREFRKEMVIVSRAIDLLICSRIAEDRDWLVQTVEERFGTKFSLDSSKARTHLGSVRFGVAPQNLCVDSKTKTMATASLIASSVALCVLTYPVLAMHSINILWWKLAGAAVAGTGFWTFIETKKDKDAKKQCLKTEIAKYILASRDENIEVLKKNIEYGYRSMKISVQDMQLASGKTVVSPVDSGAITRFRSISEINRQCDEIISTFISHEE